MLLALDIALMLYQVRFYVFGTLLAIVPCALWVTRVFTAGREQGGSRIAYLAPLVLSNPALWALPVTLVFPPPADDLAETPACLSEETLAALADVPPGMILADVNVGTFLMEDTPHSVMNANYHRDTAGIAASLQAFGLPPEKVLALLAENGVDYVLMCPNAPENRTFTRLRPEGFLARLSAGEVPGWLQPVGAPPEDPESGRLYRVTPGN